MQKQQAGAGQKQQAPQTMTPKEEQQKEKQRIAEALLKELGKEEANAQKNMLMQKMAVTNNNLSSSQNPW